MMRGENKGGFMKVFFVLMSLGFLGLVLTMTVGPAKAADKITCASTTSTQNSGLFDVLLPAFKKATGIEVAVVAVGTGQAIEMARRGDADVLFVHDPEKEEKFVADGFGLARKLVMYNDFIIVGPTSDMAKIKGLKDATEAFKKMAAAGFHFVSRGDKSGTHSMEQKIWKKAGVDPTGKPAYLEAGQGMENTLRMASEKQFYTLTDRGTWLAVKDKDKLALEMMVEGDPVLFNQYGVMVVNPAKHAHTKVKEATTFADWLTSPEGQKVIGDFKDKNGNQLFIPNAKTGK
jgi:tungstate transport system substrate-binding protein